MKSEIHPVYPPSRVTCMCGNVVETKSTRGSFSVEICSNCHPFFTGKYKLVDTAGRIDRFRKKYAATGKEAAPVAEGGAAAPAAKGAKKPKA